MNVVIYARYSSHAQNEQSIEGQLKTCYEFAQRNDYVVIGEYIDRAISGTSDNRPEFQRMIDDSNRKHFAGVLVYQLDRFARNRYDSAINKAKLKKNGVRVLSARENISDDASGALMEGVLESMAEYYSKELSQKIRRGMELNAQKGLSNGSNPGLGFKVNNDRKIVLDEEKAYIVKEIFERYANGDNIIDIVSDLNKRQIKTSIGREFNKNSLRRMLKNKRYTGSYIYKDIEVKDAIPQIIDDELFSKVSNIIEKHRIAPAMKKAVEEYLLTTKLFCGHCKDMMTGKSGYSKTGRLYSYYVCKKAKQKICDKENVGKDYIENLVINECSKLLTTQNINMLVKEIVALMEREQENPKLKSLQKLLKDNEKQTKNLFDALKICEDQSVKTSILDEIANMNKTKKELEGAIAIEGISQIPVTASEIRFFFNHLKKGNIKDIKHRKTLINVFVNKIYLYDDKITIIFNAGEKPVEVDLKMIEDIERENSSSVESFAPPFVLNLYCECALQVFLFLEAI